MADDSTPQENIKHLWEIYKNLDHRSRAKLRLLIASLTNLTEQIENGNIDFNSEEFKQIFGDKRSFVADIDSTINLQEEFKNKLVRLEYCQEHTIRNNRGRNHQSRYVDSGIESASSQLLTCSIDSTMLSESKCIQEETPHSSDTTDTSTNGIENEDISGTRM